MNIYYRIWADCIERLKSIDSNKNNWKSKSMISMTIAMTFNFVFIMAILQKKVFDNFFYEINITSLSNFENYILTISILYIIPCGIINYLFVFFGNKYKKILKNYSYKNGILFLSYFIISLFLPIISLWVGILF